ncbi:glycosyltransferase [Microbacterium sp. NPDC091313]
MDIEFVRAQGGPHTRRGAIRRYVRGGFRQGFGLNPLFMEQLVSMQLSDAGRVPALYAYLVNDRARIRTSVLWDAPQWGQHHPDAEADAAGPLGSAWRSLVAGGSVALGAPASPSTMGLAELRTLARRAVEGRRGQTRKLSIPAEVTNVLLFALGSEERDLALAIDTALDAAAELGAYVVWAVPPTGVDASFAVTVLADSGDTGVVWIAPRARLAETVDQVSPARPSRAGLIVREANVEIAASGLVRLARSSAAMARGAVLLDTDGVVRSAGQVPYHDETVDLLRGHPIEDVRALGVSVAVTRLSGGAYALAAGADPNAISTAATLTDVIAIAPGDVSPHAAIGAADPPAGDLETLLARLGFAADGVDDGVVQVRRARATPQAQRLRWAIKTAAPAGLAAEWWGDTHFARGLAGALRSLGQDVVIDSYGARDRPSRHLDDVVLVLRGPQRIEAQQGAVNLLWIISHPDEISADEVSAFDRVFAASASWSASAGPRLGSSITPLLQCTDVERFHPRGLVRTDEIVFVGTARGIARPSVIEPIRAGIDVSVYGPDWTGWIPASSVRASGLSNELLPELYESARIVLNDHWPAMQAAGFISNRLFDVVAAGGRAVSDDVVGIADIFGRAVRTYASIPQLLDLLSAPDADTFPPAAELDAIAARIREQHSFDARARTLLEAALSAGDAGSAPTSQ